MRNGRLAERLNIERVLTINPARCTTFRWIEFVQHEAVFVQRTLLALCERRS